MLAKGSQTIKTTSSTVSCERMELLSVAHLMLNLALLTSFCADFKGKASNIVLTFMAGINLGEEATFPVTSRQSRMVQWLGALTWE